MVIEGGIGVVSLPPEAMPQVEVVINSYGLDFDDAHQYVAAEREQATIVSFDKDFDKTTQGRQTLGQIIKQRS